MGTSQSLPVRMFLLAYDLGKDKESDKAWLDYLVQGRPWPSSWLMACSPTPAQPSSRRQASLASSPIVRCRSTI
jgi:hypothetical protein